MRVKLNWCDNAPRLVCVEPLPLPKPNETKNEEIQSGGVVVCCSLLPWCSVFLFPKPYFGMCSGSHCRKSPQKFSRLRRDPHTLSFWGSSKNSVVVENIIFRLPPNYLQNISLKIAPKYNTQPHTYLYFGINTQAFHKGTTAIIRLIKLVNSAVVENNLDGSRK